MNKQLFTLCIVLFVVTRFYMLFLFQPHNSDVSLYAQYAFEYLLASKQHVSFYKLHKKRIEAEKQEALRNNLTVPDEEQKIVPYPPLAIQMLRIPSLFVKTDASWSRQSFMSFDASYRPVFRAMLFLFDLINFMVIMIYLVKQKNALSFFQKTFIALGYVAGVLTMPHILYDRLDLVIGTLLLVSTALMLLKKNYLWSFVALAASINFKISPIVLVPLYAMASIAVNNSGKSRVQDVQRFPWKLLAVRCVVVSGLILALFAPFAFIFGQDSISSFLYQFQRGLHIESSYSAFVLLLSAFSPVVCSVGFGYGSFMLNSPFSRALSALSGPLTLAAMACVCYILYRWYNIKNRQPVKTAPQNMADLRDKSINQLLVIGQLLCVSALIVFSKNFSPQYLFWLFPLLFVMDFRIRNTTRAAVIYVAACILTTVIFPYYYFSDIVTQFTSFGKMLLVTRAAVIVWFMASVLLIFMRETKSVTKKSLK
jgi:hypothetical protein